MTRGKKNKKKNQNLKGDISMLLFIKTLFSNKKKLLCLNMNIKVCFSWLGKSLCVCFTFEKQIFFYYNSMSWASSSEKSDIELSDELSPVRSSCSLSASSVAYFWMYSRVTETKC